MRLTPVTDSESHVPVEVTPNDHHPAAASVSIENTTQSISALSTYNLDVSVGQSDFQLAQITLRGPKQMSGGTWREGASIHATRTASDAMGHSVQGSSFKKVYAVTYAKAAGSSYLTQKVFDTLGRIVVQDVVLTGSVLRITFFNTTAIATTLNVKGEALLR